MPKINVVERIARRLGEQRDGECWETDYRRAHGWYPQVRHDDRALGHSQLHRVVWEIHNAEPIPEGMVIRHTCDNPACCNPEHLVLGTQADNLRDCRERGRAVKPPQPPPYPQWKIDCIKKLFAIGCSKIGIAEMLKCSQETVAKYCDAD